MDKYQAHAPRFSNPHLTALARMCTLSQEFVLFLMLFRILMRNPDAQIATLDAAGRGLGMTCDDMNEATNNRQ